MIAYGLPPGSRVWVAQGSDDMWTNSDYLMAEVIDTLRVGNWLVANRDVERSKQSPQPEPFTRPADMRADRERASRVMEKASKGADFMTMVAARRAEMAARQQQQ